MKNNEIGMNIDEINKYNRRLKLYANIEYNNFFSISEINEGLTKAYSSKNSVKLNTNNKYILDSETTKAKNLSRYYKYIDSIVTIYTNFKNEVVNIDFDYNNVK